MTLICCLNPHCKSPLNPESASHCHLCGTPLIRLLRDRFRVVEPLGQGGFGKTYLAEDVDKFDERCVIKQLAPQSHLQTTDEVWLRFRQEAHQLQRLGQHPQIPELGAFFKQTLIIPSGGHHQSQDYHFLTMQFIPGVTLEEELYRYGRFGENQIWGLLHNLLPVLKFVHEQGVVHRDLKTSNIMRRTTDSQFVLIDFGIAKQVDSRGHAHTETAIGSQGFSAYEQMEFGQASPASDLFSLGVTCFHLLTNHHPSGLMRHEGYRWLEHWQRHLPQLDPRLEQVLGQLLVKDPARRCPSSEVLLKQLPALEAERWELHPWSSKFVTEPLPACKLDEIGDRAVDQSPLPLVSPIVYPKKAGLLKPIPLSMVCQWLLEVSLGALAGAIAGINLALILIAPAIYILSRVAFGERSLEEAYFLGTRSGLLTGTVLGMFAGAVPSARVRVKQEITKRFKGRRKFPTATRSRRRR